MKTNEMKTYEVPEIDLVKVEINNAIMGLSDCDSYECGNDTEDPGSGGCVMY